MKIAFYAPLKPPAHPVPSGDRLMARLLMACLERAGHTVLVASHLRAFSRDPSTQTTEIRAAAMAEIDRLRMLWQAQGRPDVWFCYHPYYKAPDLIGPVLAREFGLAYVTVEASYSQKRNTGHWAEAQARVRASVAMADVNICMTQRDWQGLADGVPGARLARLKPFIDPALFLVPPPQPKAGRLVTVAMMRPGDKMDSYRMLAAALSRLPDLPFSVDIVGGGPCFDEVQALFSEIPSERLTWRGECSPEQVAQILSQASVFVWPGCGEAYGLAYLEAQAAGLPVVAQAIAGVPEVVEHDHTGLLTTAGDVEAYASAIAGLLTQAETRARLSLAARRFAGIERSIDRAANILDRILGQALEGRQ